MCLPSKSNPTSRAVLGLGALMLAACLVGPALGGLLLAVLLCVALPAVVLAWRRITDRRLSRPGL